MQEKSQKSTNTAIPDNGEGPLLEDGVCSEGLPFVNESPHSGASSQAQLVVNLPPPHGSDGPDVMAALMSMERRLVNVMQTEKNRSHDTHQRQAERERQQYEDTIKILKEQLQNKNMECDQLKSGVLDLRSQVSKLTTDLNQTKWKNFRDRTPVSNPKVLLMGSSMIRDIDEHKLSNTKVTCLPGAHISDLTREMKKQDTSVMYDKSVIIGGGNDCSSNNNIPELVAKYKELIIATKATARSVAVASICPRGPEQTQSCIDSLNAGIQGLCEDLGCVYTDTSDILKLKDGSINEGYYMDDMVHLTYKGQNKVAQKLGLIPADASGTYSVVSTKRPRQKQQAKQETINHIGNDQRHKTMTAKARYAPRDDTRRTHTAPWTPRDYSMKNALRCDFCAEPHHNTDRCRHQAAVKCYECGYEGHKSKFCESTRKNNEY